jgi:hypothetical protein
MSEKTPRERLRDAVEVCLVYGEEPCSRAELRLIEAARAVLAEPEPEPESKVVYSLRRELDDAKRECETAWYRVTQAERHVIPELEAERDRLREQVRIAFEQRDVAQDRCAELESRDPAMTDAERELCDWVGAEGIPLDWTELNAPVSATHLATLAQAVRAERLWPAPERTIDDVLDEIDEQLFDRNHGPSRGNELVTEARRLLGKGE